MIKKSFLFILLIILPALVADRAFCASQPFVEYCSKSYSGKKVCPQDICQLQCADGTQTPQCDLTCVPKECDTFSAGQCPEMFCVAAEDCGKRIQCLQKPAYDQIPPCAGLGEHPQFAKCCAGFTARCGFDYLDGKCNMEGKNTAYNFPICIPCGDGNCTNFENHCNCPEDCKKDIIPLN